MYVSIQRERERERSKQNYLNLILTTKLSLEAAAVSEHNWVVKPMLRGH